MRSASTRICAAVREEVCKGRDRLEGKDCHSTEGKFPDAGWTMRPFGAWRLLNLGAGCPSKFRRAFRRRQSSRAAGRVRPVYSRVFKRFRYLEAWTP